MEKNDYVLSETEYKNIEARLIKTICYYFIVLIAVYLLANYFALKHFTTAIVSSYISKENVIKELNYNLEETKALMQSKYANFLDTFDIIKTKYFKEIEFNGKLPYSINNNVIILFQDTSKIIIEYGSGYTLDTIYFKAKFKNTPIVMINVDDNDLSLLHPILRRAYFSDKRNIYHQVYTSLNSFYAISRHNIRYLTKINKKYPITWVAFGK